MKGKYYMLYCVLLLPLGGWTQTLLTSVSPAVPFVSEASHAWADVDGDGQPDLYLSGLDAAGQSRSWLLHNTGSALVAASNQSLTPLTGGVAAWADYDGDGDPDLAVTGSSGYQSGFSRIYENVNGQLQPSGIGLPALLEGQLAWADFDGDGRLDLYVGGLSTSDGLQGYLLHNRGQGQFQQVHRPDLAPLIGGRTAIGDIDGDGQPDVVQAGLNPESEAELIVHYNRGNLNFSPASTPHKGLHHPALSVADTDNDGKLEVYLSGATARPAMMVYEFQGNDLVHTGTSLPGLSRGTLTFCDFDGDGDPDLIHTGTDGEHGQTRIYENSGGTFSLLQSPLDLPTLFQTTVSVADWNGDGYPDILITGRRPRQSGSSYLLTYDPTTNTFQP